MNTKVKKLADTVKPVRRGTPEMESLLSVGYGGMTVEDAERIIREREANPLTHDIKDYKDAKAFLAAYNAKGEDLMPTSKKPGWKRTRDFG